MSHAITATFIYDATAATHNTRGVNELGIDLLAP